MRCDLPSCWLEGTLGEHVDLLAGFAFQSERFSDDRRDTRLLRGDNVAQGRLRWDGARRWPKAQRADFARYELELGDVVLAMDRPWIEAGLKFAVVRKEDLPSLLVQRVARLRARETLNQRFLAYLIADRRFTAYVQAVQTGTAVPHISGSQIAGFPIRLPSLNEQARIADVLGALDDKIDGNGRLAELLEEMATTDFRARFIDYVGFADFEEDQLGPIPTGWRTSEIGALASVNEHSYSGRDHPAEITYVDISSVAPGWIRDARRIAFEEAPSRARRAVKSGDTIISTVRPERRSFAFLHRAEPGLTASTGFAVVTPKNAAPTFVYRWVTSDACVNHLAACATGSAYPAVNPSALATWRVPVPPDAGESYEEFARPIEASKHALNREAATLAEIRDTLLPKLISGEIRVPDTADPEEVIGPAVEEIAA